MKTTAGALAPIAAALLCCFGVSFLAAAGATTLLGLVGVALPAAILVGAALWGAWLVAKRIRAS